MKSIIKKTEQFWLFYNSSPLPWTTVLPGFSQLDLSWSALSYVGKLSVHRIPLQKWSVSEKLLFIWYFMHSITLNINIFIFIMLLYIWMMCIYVFVCLIDWFNCLLNKVLFIFNQASNFYWQSWQPSLTMSPSRSGGFFSLLRETLRAHWMLGTATPSIHTVQSSEEDSVSNENTCTDAWVHVHWLHILMHSVPRMESTMMHKFSHAGVFTVSVECTTSDWRVTAEKTITVQEPVTQFGAIRCYSRNVSTDGNKCNVFHDGPAHVQVQAEQGESVKYWG